MRAMREASDRDCVRVVALRLRRGGRGKKAHDQQRRRIRRQDTNGTDETDETKETNNTNGTTQTGVGALDGTNCPIMNGLSLFYAPSAHSALAYTREYFMAECIHHPQPACNQQHQRLTRSSVFSPDAITHHVVTSAKGTGIRGQVQVGALELVGVTLATQCGHSIRGGLDLWSRL